MIGIAIGLWPGAPPSSAPPPEPGTPVVDGSTVYAAEWVISGSAVRAYPAAPAQIPVVDGSVITGVTHA